AGVFAKARLHGHDLAAYDYGGVYFAIRHAEQIEDANSGPGGNRLKPQPEIAHEDEQKNQAKNNDRAQDSDADDASTGQRILLREQLHWFSPYFLTCPT